MAFFRYKIWHFQCNKNNSCLHFSQM